MKTRNQVMSLLAKKYPGMFLRTTEEFSGSKGGIWTSGEDGPAAKDGSPLFDYWTENQTKYNLGVHTEIYDYLDELQWYCEWNDAGTIMIWPQ
jgi:hypothetical protein